MINSVIQGDCLEVLKTFPDNYFDSLVTDPPYGLSNHKPEEVVNCLMAWCKGEVYQPKGSGFMGKTWDSWVPGPDVWKEVYRVLKPGAHALIFAGTRSVDLMGTSVRLAGFELRDMIVWSHGQGFPKNLDVSKAIDKVSPRLGMFDAFAQHFWDCWQASGLIRRDFIPHFPHYKNAESIMAQLSNWKLAKNVPSRQDFEILKKIINLSSDWQQLIDRVETERNVIGRGVSGKTAIWADGGMGNFDITAPATPEAKHWNGWGTALKPAIEPILLCRKPLDGTVANNVLKHGVGGINIEACRIGTDGGTTRGENGSNAGKPRNTLHAGNFGVVPLNAGRYPANLVLSCGANCDGETHSPDCPVTVIGDQSGICTSGGSAGNRNFENNIFKLGLGKKTFGDDIPKSTGTAARYFKQLPFDPETAHSIYYQAKASKSDRSCGGKVKNVHPTVKSTALISYLIKLITPPDGIVLDCFGGSGTTAVSAIKNDFNYVLIEKESEYIEIINQRIAATQGKETEMSIAVPPQPKTTNQKTAIESDPIQQLSLF